jgi:hypothetical protein
VETVPQYGRWSKEFGLERKIDRVGFVTPEGLLETRPTFVHEPVELAYDRHGYEGLLPSGRQVAAVRFTPVQPGRHRYRALSQGKVAEEGEFACERSDHPGYVEVSKKDPRYFALSNGAAFCPIGLNLAFPPSYPLPRGTEHFLVSEKRATLGVREYRRWFQELARNGGNLARIYLSWDYFSPETEVAGQLEPARFARLDAVVEAARECGVRLKVCLEHFRTFEPAAPFAKVLKHPGDGRAPRDMDEWFRAKTWQDLWMRKVHAWFARYGDDPTIMAWELWNELECCATQDWPMLREWARGMLRVMKEMAPRQLVTNTLGSLDRESQLCPYGDFHMDEMDFQQVHRYLDQGADLGICHHDPVAFCADAIRVARRPDRPILMSETGGVNDCHTGPFPYYRMDARGSIFCDVTFAPFFAGSAGTGQIWHWYEYVDQKGLWPAYRPFADLVSGIQLDAEDFKVADVSTDRAWFLCLRGDEHLLAYVRNRQDSWYAVLRDGHAPEVLTDQTFDLSPLGVRSGKPALYRPWPEPDGEATLRGGRLRLPPFWYGFLLKIRLGSG